MKVSDLIASLATDHPITSDEKEKPSRLYSEATRVNTPEFKDMFTHAIPKIANNNYVSDTVSLSSTLVSLETQASQVEKLDRLRSSISAGTYSVPSMDVADVMLKKGL